MIGMQKTNRGEDMSHYYDENPDVKVMKSILLMNVINILLI